ncbi:2'-5' RNA ligase family protein [uncultured Pseudokineococcus sp.]|uniref:2'-5' RNA ligase family protein n=1 Tax=uncultured Pseudokineococcus sp. TaxID=1642928 RepID=UPI002610FAB2|nr:2'-5' RNA ligase family protein [uncultured Pseudokineococcus sp.]
MAQTAELLLDAATEDAVLAQWRALVEADLPSQARHTGETNRPHVTLAVAGALPDDLDEPLRHAAGDLPLPVRLGPLVVLGGRRHVLARLLVATPDLLALHARTAEVVRGCPDRSELVEPGAWTPHVTLARGLSGEQVAAALAALGRPADLTASVTGVRRFDGDARAVRLVAGRDERGLSPGG